MPEINDIKPQPASNNAEAANNTNVSGNNSTENTGQPNMNIDLPANTPKPKSNKFESVKRAFSTFAFLIIAPLIAIVLTLFVFQSYEVDGPSMETTLQNKDRLIVLKVPRTWARITGHAYIPDRGDIVVFTRIEGEEFGGNIERQLIKRVIGLPGDRVVVKDGTVKVYNRENPDGFEPDDVQAYGINVGPTSGNTDITVGKDELFVMGDNRPNSLDSRSFGTIKANAVVGKLLFRIYPFNKGEVF